MSQSSYRDEVEPLVLSALRALAAEDRGSAVRLYVAIEQFAKVAHLGGTADFAELLATRDRTAMYLVPPSHVVVSTDAVSAIVLVDHCDKVVKVLKVLDPSDGLSLEAILVDVREILKNRN